MAKKNQLHGHLKSIGPVSIPDISAKELLTILEGSFREADLPFTRFDEELKRWDFLLNEERGKTYEGFVGSFGRLWTSYEGMTLQTSLGADGVVAAAIAYLIKEKPLGYFSCIPNQASRRFNVRRRSEALFFAHTEEKYARHNASREIYTWDIDRGWRPDEQLLTFQPI